MSSSAPSQRQLAPSAPGEVRVARALLSVSDKTGIVDFARGLSELGVELISTGGTAAALTEAGLTVRTITDLTGFPEIMDGRVKTLHPKLYAGLLAVRSNQEHVDAAREHEVEPVDLVCVNLYPFEQTAARAGVSEAEVIENIDIGGPTMIRAAAKNTAYAAPVVSPDRYESVLEELRGSGGRLSLATREALAAEAFAYTARYDASISAWFQGEHGGFPQTLTRSFVRFAELPYGENPHQQAAYYAGTHAASSHLLAGLRQLGGKQLSYNNLLDLEAARNLLDEFPDQPACVIVKHNTPCGVAVGDSALAAYQRAFACDPMSAFGGIVVLNRPVGAELADALLGQFIEVLLAPGFDEVAQEKLQTKPNMRVLEDSSGPNPSTATIHSVRGGLLVQERDMQPEPRSEMKVATARQPTEAEWRALEFAWKVCKHVKSNAIVLANEFATVGIGGGQMSRVDASRIAVEKAQSPLEGCVMASDAYFPFPDGLQIGLDAGIKAVIQPGGSIRDQLSIDAVEQVGGTMVFAGRRHFRH
jgi:phosphoribosylaminoimidazolecarboxamide formyltransferase/IMP cyclohydrolase